MKNSNMKKWITLLVLCAGGGVIYRLPYLREVFYIPMQNVFGFDNFQMGFLTSMYGIVSFIGYRIIFIYMIALCVVGLISSLVLYRMLYKNKSLNKEPELEVV